MPVKGYRKIRGTDKSLLGTHSAAKLPGVTEPSQKVVEALEKAVAAVDKAKVPKDLREIAFKAALADASFREVPPGDPPPGDPPPPPVDPSDGVGKLLRLST
jgi:hypothetical protein